MYTGCKMCGAPQNHTKNRLSRDEKWVFKVDVKTDRVGAVLIWGGGCFIVSGRQLKKHGRLVFSA